jgi:hypothetical protein
VALGARLDTSTFEFFAQKRRCMLRIEVTNEGARAIEAVELDTHLAGQAMLEPARAANLDPGERAVLTVWLVPEVAGFQELKGELRVRDAAGETARFTFDRVLFRVGGGDGPHIPQVSIVHIDQSSARIVDNSRSQFAAPAPIGGLVGNGTWHALPIVRVPSPPPVRASEPPAPVSAPVSFHVTTAVAAYDVDATIAQGDIATVYRGRRRSDAAPVAVKVVDGAGDDDLMQAELRALRILAAEASPQRKHLPVVLDSFRTADGRTGTVFEELDGIDLVALRARLPGGIPEVHLLWLMRRVLSVLGHAHAHGIVHGNVDPAHIVVRPKDHNVWLVDWCWSVVNPAQTGEGFRCRNETYGPPEVALRKAPLPSADIYSLGKCMFFAAGGDPTRRTLPEGIGPRLARLLEYATTESALGRPQDAWRLYAELDRLREQILGPHKFIEFVI